MVDAIKAAAKASQARKCQDIIKARFRRQHAWRNGINDTILTATHTAAPLVARHRLASHQGAALLSFCFMTVHAAAVLHCQDTWVYLT